MNSIRERMAGGDGMLLVVQVVPLKRSMAAGGWAVGVGVTARPDK